MGITDVFDDIRDITGDIERSTDDVFDTKDRIEEGTGEDPKENKADEIGAENDILRERIEQEQLERELERERGQGGSGEPAPRRRTTETRRETTIERDDDETTIEREERTTTTYPDDRTQRRSPEREQHGHVNGDLSTREMLAGLQAADFGRANATHMAENLEAVTGIDIITEKGVNADRMAEAIEQYVVEQRPEGVSLEALEEVHNKGETVRAYTKLAFAVNEDADRLTSRQNDRPEPERDSEFGERRAGVEDGVVAPEEIEHSLMGALEDGLMDSTDATQMLHDLAVTTCRDPDDMWKSDNEPDWEEVARAANDYNKAYDNHPSVWQIETENPRGAVEWSEHLAEHRQAIADGEAEPAKPMQKQRPDRGQDTPPSVTVPTEPVEPDGGNRPASDRGNEPTSSAPATSGPETLDPEGSDMSRTEAYHMVRDYVSAVDREGRAERNDVLEEKLEDLTGASFRNERGRLDAMKVVEAIRGLDAKYDLDLNADSPQELMGQLNDINNPDRSTGNTAQPPEQTTQPDTPGDSTASLSYGSANVRTFVDAKNAQGFSDSVNFLQTSITFDGDAPNEPVNPNVPKQTNPQQEKSANAGIGD